MINIGVLGTGMVGKAIATKLIQLGYNVMMGSRTATNEKALAWVAEHGSLAQAGTFADAAAFGELIFNCTKGEITLEVFKAIPTQLLEGKTIVDLSNALDYSHGMPPVLNANYCNTYSLGEAIQALLPQANVVKSLNIITADGMVNPQKCGQDLTMFMSGNSAEAKAEVEELLMQFGWQDIIDLGDITTARGTEMILPVWLRIYGQLKSPYFGFKIAR